MACQPDAFKEIQSCVYHWTPYWLVTALRLGGYGPSSLESRSRAHYFRLFVMGCPGIRIWALCMTKLACSGRRGRPYIRARPGSWTGCFKTLIHETLSHLSEYWGDEDNNTCELLLCKGLVMTELNCASPADWRPNVGKSSSSQFATGHVQSLTRF